MAQITARAFGGICIDGACPAWDVSWSTDRPYQKKPLRPLPLVEDPFEHIGMGSRLGQIAPRPKLGNGGAMAGQWRGNGGMCGVRGGFPSHGHAFP